MANHLVRGGFSPSADLMMLYSLEDKRKALFYQGVFSKRVYKSSVNEPNVFGKALRTAELYLNRAEAYAELEQLSMANNDLEELRKYRMTGAYQVSYTDKDDLLGQVKDERRRELSFEDHRWFDLRRSGMPRIEHTLKESAGADEVTYVLEEKDPAYTLPIPINIFKSEPYLINIQRPVRNPIN